MHDMMGEPKVISEGYAYIDDKTEKWCLKEDAPDWAKREFEEFFGAINAEPDDNDIVTMY
jgi:hypothetical protein